MPKHIYLCSVESLAAGLEEGLAAPVKIGVAMDTLYRLSGIQSSHWEPVVLLAEYREAGTTLERRLHASFAHKRIRSEWFLLSADDMMDINDIMDEWL